MIDNNLDCTVIVLHPCAHRVPVCGDVYVAKDGTLKRCKGKNYSKRAKKKYIVFSWREQTEAKIVHSTNVSVFEPAISTTQEAGQ